MADFSLTDALADDNPSKANKIGQNNPSAASNAPSANPGWPGSAPGAPAQPSAPGEFAGGPSAPGFPGQFPGGQGPFPSVPGAPGQYPGPPSVPGGFPPGIPGQFPPAPGAPGQFPSGPGAPGQFPGHYPSEGTPGQLPGGPVPYPAGPFPSGPGAPPGPYPNMPFPGVQPGAGNGMYGPGGPGAFPPAYQGWESIPPMPSGSWGPPAGGFPPAPGQPFGPGPMGQYGGHPAQGGMLMVPYDLPLVAGIMPRLLITIVGEPVPGADRFQVDFVKGGDVVFHFNPRFPEQTIVRNSNLGGCWGPEEREGAFPFVQGQRFELKILVEETMFKVAVDGNHILEYEHRVGGLEEVNLLRVYGDLALYSAAPSMIDI